MRKLSLILRKIQLVCIVVWNFLSQNVKVLVLSVGNLFHSIAECGECKILKQWNDDLKRENEYLKSLLLEPTVENKEAKVIPREEFKPVGRRSSWRGTQQKLTKKYYRLHKEEIDKEAVVE